MICNDKESNLNINEYWDDNTFELSIQTKKDDNYIAIDKETLSLLSEKILNSKFDNFKVNCIDSKSDWIQFSPNENNLHITLFNQNKNTIDVDITNDKIIKLIKSLDS